MQVRALVVAQTPRFVKDNVGQLGNIGPHRLDLVDLFLVLHDGEPHARMMQHIGHFLGDGICIDGNRNGLERLSRAKRPVKPRPVGADNGDAFAFGQAHGLQAEREVANLVTLLRPGPGLPDAVILDPHRRPG